MANNKDKTCQVYEASQWKNLNENTKNGIESVLTLGENLFIVADGFFEAIKTKDYMISDLGNAKFFLDHPMNGLLEGDKRKIIYHPAHKSSYIYGINPANGCYSWNEDINDAELKKKIDKFTDYLAELCNSLDITNATPEAKKEVKGYKELISKRYSSFANGSMKNIIDRIHGITSRLDVKFDDPDLRYLINCPNGIYNMRTRKLEPHKMDYFLTNGCPTECHLGKTTDDFEKYINSICVNAPIKSLLSQAIGVAMDATLNTKKVGILFGALTNNGKTSFCEIVAQVVGRASSGGYYASTSIKTFSESARDAGKANPELAALDGARIVVAAEPKENEGVNIDWGFIKELSGGATVMPRKLYHEPKPMKCDFSIFIDTNYLLSCADPTLFTSDRLQIINFNAVFSKDESKNPVDAPNENIKELMGKKANREAMLAWMIDGYNSFVDNGKNYTETVESQETLAMYRNTSDRYKEFFDAFYEKTSNYKDHVPVKAIWEKWKEWCIENGYKHGNYGNFVAKIGHRYNVQQDSSNTYQVVGLIEKAAASNNKILDFDTYFNHYLKKDGKSSIALKDLFDDYTGIANKLLAASMSESAFMDIIDNRDFDTAKRKGIHYLDGYRFKTNEELQTALAERKKACEDEAAKKLDKAIDKIDHPALSHPILKKAMRIIIKYRKDEAMKSFLEFLFSGDDEIISRGDEDMPQLMI